MSYKRPRPSKHRTNVKRSSAGLGLFAQKSIEKGEFVIEYYGPLLDDPEADAKGGKYLFAIDKRWTIDGSSRKNKARYINHACRPNCEVEIEGKRIFVFAKKNISSGEEITYHYGKDYFDGFIKPYGCRCPQHKKRKRPNR